MPITASFPFSQETTLPSSNDGERMAGIASLGKIVTISSEGHAEPRSKRIEPQK
jgi:hypothetical protein